MKISKQMLISLRGRHSARAFSQKLNYNSNQISRWESGHSRMSWSDFLDLCDRLKLPLNAAFAEMEFHQSPTDIKALFQYLLPGRKSEELAKVCGVSKLTVQRWFNKRLSPPVDLIFNIFGTSGTPLGPFLQPLLSSKKTSPALTKFLAAEQDRLSTMIETPWTIAIACLCLLDQFKGLNLDRITSQISKQTGISNLQVKDLVHRLIRTRLLSFDIEKNQFSVSQGPTHFEFRDSFQSFMNGVQFWAQFSRTLIDQKTEKDRGENHISYLIFNCQSREVQKIHEKIINLYKELTEISQQAEYSGSADRTFALNMHLHNVNHPALGALIERWNRR
ncbi:MAG: hypothetical protein AAGB31_11080 [Bdellovibrio sp.]